MRALAVVVTLVVAGVIMSPTDAQAKSIKVFKNEHGWEPGDRSDTRSADGLEVSIRIEKSTNSGRMYVRAEFCNDRGSDWEGGIRVTASYPDEAHARIRVRGQSCRTWSEHLPLQLREIFVLVDRAD